jgi:putative DNA primase/helicase
MAQRIIAYPEPVTETVAPPDKVERWKPDDDILAQELVPKLKETVAHFHSEWKVYEDGAWRPRHISRLRKYVREQLRNYRSSGVAVNQSRIASLASMLEDDLYLPDQEVSAKADERKRYINLTNGLFNLETFELEPWRRDLYFTTQLSFPYEYEAECPTFRKYLASSLVYPDGKTDRSLVELVKQALAYSMTARTDLKASFWLVGEKDSGKSTFVSVIKGLMGDLHTTVDLGQLGKNRFLLAPIVGKRVITFTEASEGSMLDDANYKTLTGGSDDITADVKNKDPITFRPEAKIWWAMNGMPRISDRSGATTRRITIIPFNRSIPQSERILDLEQRLLAERSGIFTEIMYSLQRLINQGHFDYCEQAEEQLAQYIAENDTEATFIEQCAERGELHRVQSADLYAAYASWCSTNGFKSKNANQIAKDWRRLGFSNRKSNESWWHGLKLK